MSDQWEALLDELAEGKQSLAAICRRADMPGLRTVYDRIERDDEFSARFRARKAIGVRCIVDDCLEIADEKVSDPLEVANKRVRIDTRLRLAGKWLAAEFGERIDVTSGGEKLANESEADKAARLAAILAAATARRGADEG